MWHFACVQANLCRLKLIVADQIAGVLSSNLCGFKLIVADQFAGVRANQAPSPPLPSEVSNLFGKYGGQVSIFPLIWFQCDGASWQLPTGVVPVHGVAMDTSLPWPEVLKPPANL